MTLITALSDLPRLTDAREVAFDLETHDPELKQRGPGTRRDAHVLGIALAVPEGQSWYVPLAHRDHTLDNDPVWRWIDTLFAKATIYGANLSYDLDYATHNGVPVPSKVRDVLHAARLLELQKAYWYPSLDYCLHKYLGEDAGKTGGGEDGLWEWLATHRGKGQPTRKDQIGFLSEAPAALVAEYAEGDVLPLFDLHSALEVRLKERSAWDWYLIEEELLPLLVLMRQRGIRVDIDGTDRLKEQFTEQYGEAFEAFGREAYPDTWHNLSHAEKDDLVSANSGLRLATLFGNRGVKVPRTWVGNPSITKEWLANRAEDGDTLATQLLRLRKYDKLRGTFLDGYITNHQVNGRVHPELMQLGPRTLRFASRNPNEQNMPARDEELAPLVRGLWLPDEGEDWVQLDFDQQEYRLLAHFGVGHGAEDARAAYRDDPTTDFHELVRGWLAKAGHDLPRKTVKNANFAKAYRAGKAKFASTLGVERAEGDRLFDLYNQQLPFVAQTAETAERVAKQRGYVQLLLCDMRMHFDRWEIADWDLREVAGQDKAMTATYETMEEAQHAAAVLVANLAAENKISGDHRPRVGKADLYKALNRVIQPSGAQLMKMALVKMHRAGLTSVLGAPLLSIHDEVDLSVPRTREGRQAAAEVARIMASADDGAARVPFLVSAKVGPSWGALQDIDDIQDWGR